MLSTRLLCSRRGDRASRWPTGIGWTIVLLALPAQLMFSSASAAALNELEITRERNAYHVSFDIVLNADVSRVRELLGDHTQWPRLSKKVTQGHHVDTFADGRERVSVSFRPCVLIFCKTVRQVKDVTRSASGEVLTDIVPEDGDFAAGWECWRILSEGDGTRVQYQAELTFGPRALGALGSWMFKTNLRSILLTSANTVETLAAL